MRLLSIMSTRFSVAHNIFHSNYRKEKNNSNTFIDLNSELTIFLRIKHWSPKLITTAELCRLLLDLLLTTADSKHSMLVSLAHPYPDRPKTKKQKQSTKDYPNQHRKALIQTNKVYGFRSGWLFSDTLKEISNNVRTNYFFK